MRNVLALVLAIALAGFGCSGGGSKDKGDKDVKPVETKGQGDQVAKPGALKGKPGDTNGADRAKKGPEFAEKKAAVSVQLKVGDLTISKDQDEGELTIDIATTGNVGDVKLTFETASDVIAVPTDRTTAEKQVVVRVLADKTKRSQEHVAVLLVTGTGTTVKATNSVKVKIKVEKK